MAVETLTNRITIRQLTEGGSQLVVPDSGTGGVWRPSLQGTQGGRIATPETLYDFWINHVPDPAWAKAINPMIYSHLRTHPDVVAARRKREYRVASFPWRFDANPTAQDKQGASLAANYCTWVFGQISNVHHIFREMQEAVVDGSRAHEYMWHREADGSERPFKAIPVDRTRFVFDRMGNMALRTRFQPVWGAYVMSNPQDPVPESAFPRGKFTYHIHLRAPGGWENPQIEGYVYYGLGEDVALAYVLLYDTFVLRFRMKWLEKFGMPTIDVYYPDAMSQYVPTARKLVDSVRGESACLIPRIAGEEYNSYFEIKQREVPSPSYDAMADFSNDWTRPRIDSILLGEYNTGNKGKQQGYSSKVQEQDAGPQVWFQYDSMNINSTISEQLVPAIIQYGPESVRNLPVSCYPLFKLEAAQDRDLMQSVGLAKQLSTLVPLSVREIYSNCGYRVPTDGEETVGGFQDPTLEEGQGQQGSESIIGSPGKINQNGEMKGDQPSLMNLNGDNNPNHQKQNPINSPKMWPTQREPQGHSGDNGHSIVGGRKPTIAAMPRVLA